MKNIFATQPISHCSNINSHHEHNQAKVSFQDKTKGYISQLSQKYTMVNIHVGGYTVSDIRGLMQEFCWGNHLFISIDFIETMCKNMDFFKKGKYILEQTLDSFFIISLPKFLATGILVLPQKKFCWHLEMIKEQAQNQQEPINNSNEIQDIDLHKKIRCKENLSQYFKGERLKKALCPPALRKSFVELSEKLNVEKIDFMLNGDTFLGELKKHITQLQKQMICYRVKILRLHWQYQQTQFAQKQKEQWNQSQIQSKQSQNFLNGRSAYLKQTAISRYLNVQKQSQQKQETPFSEKDSLHTKAQSKSADNHQKAVLLSAGLQATLSSQRIDF